MSTDKKPKYEEALDYIGLVARDALEIHVTWDFDEQQADPCHHNFDGRRFIRCLNVVLEKLRSENKNK